MSNQISIQLFTPYNKQEEIINGFADSIHKFGVVSVGRQAGKSLLAQNLILYWLLGKNDQIGAWIAPTYNQCRKVFKELNKYCKEIITNNNKSELTIEFINGSTLQFLSADRPNNIRGFSFHYMVIDEAAFIPELGFNESILPTLTALGKKCLIISTPKKGWFHTYFLKGQDKENNTYISFAGTSYDNPYADHSFIDEQRKSLPTPIFEQEYLAKFTDASADVFRNIDNSCSLRDFSRNSPLKLFFGIDVGLANDYTVVTVIDQSGKVIDILRFNGGTINDASEKIYKFLSQYKLTGGYCETNNIGKAIYENLKPKLNSIKPWVTTQDNKFQAVSMLISDMEEMKLELPSRDLFPYLYNEMSAWIYKMSPNGKVSFTHPSGLNDDCVDSLWLANYARNTIVTANRIYINGKYI